MVEVEDVAGAEVDDSPSVDVDTFSMMQSSAGATIKVSPTKVGRQGSLHAAAARAVAANRRMK